MKFLCLILPHFISRFTLLLVSILVYNKLPVFFSVDVLIFLYLFIRRKLDGHSDKIIKRSSHLKSSYAGPRHAF